MGAAKRRGNYEERKVQGEERKEAERLERENFLSKRRAIIKEQAKKKPVVVVEPNKSGLTVQTAAILLSGVGCMMV